MRFRKFAAALLLAALCLSTCIPVALAADQIAVSPELKARVQITGVAPIPKDEITLELRADENKNATAPMPAETQLDEAGKTVSRVTVNTDSDTNIDDVLEANFGSITYTTPGYYYYTVSIVEDDGPTGYDGTVSYDPQALYIKVKAEWSDNMSVFGTTLYAYSSSDYSSSDKLADLNFVVTYTYNTPYIPVPDDPIIPDVPDENNPPAPITPDNPPVQDETPGEPATPVNPPVQDETPDEPTAPAPETPVNPPVQDEKPPKLIQTGQLNWPVPVLTGTGVALIALGIALSHHSKGKDDNA